METLGKEGFKGGGVDLVRGQDPLGDRHQDLVVFGP
jgi:hypothetical protein